MPEPTPLEALCLRIAREVGPFPAMTPEAQAKAEEKHQAALRAPFTLTGAEARQLAEVAAYALGFRHAHRSKEIDTAHRKATKGWLLQALDEADAALGRQGKAGEP